MQIQKEKNVLTNKEVEIYNLMLAGKTNEEIRNVLCWCRGSVEKYITSIFLKKNVRNRVELIRKHYEEEL